MTKKHGNSPIQIKKTPLLVHYLDQLKKKEAYGGNHTQIASAMMWRGIEELLSRGIIKPHEK